MFAPTIQFRLPIETRLHRAVGLLSWALFAGVVAFSLIRTIGKDEDCQNCDFGAYYHAGKMVSEGRSPYITRIEGFVDGAFVYSPAFAYFFRLFEPLGYINGVRAWMVINWALVVACIAMSLYLVRGKISRDDLPWGIVWLALLPTLSHFWNNVRVGQAAVVMLAGCLAWAVCRRCGRSFAGGLALAAACAVKVTPIVLVPYLLVRRDWRGLGGVAAGGAALLLLPMPWVGPAGTMALYREWSSLLQTTQSVNQTVRPINQSVLGMLARLPSISNGVHCYSLERLKALEHYYPYLVLGLTVACYAAVALHLRSRRDATPVDDQGSENLHLSMLLLLVMLINPRAWSCNYVNLILPCLVLAEGVWNRRPGWQPAAVALAYTTFASILSTQYAVGDQWSWSVWLNNGRHFWGATAVGLTCVRIYVRSQVAATDEADDVETAAVLKRLAA